MMKQSRSSPALTREINGRLYHLFLTAQTRLSATRLLKTLLKPKGRWIAGAVKPLGNREWGIYVR